MSRKTTSLVVTTLILFGAYIYYFTDLFHSDQMLITYQIRPGRPVAPDSTVYPVLFNLDRKYRLSLVKVVPVKDTNSTQQGYPVWHLVSESNSAPTKAIVYGTPIQGMKPAVAQTMPKPLEPNITYRLLLEAGAAKGQIDFRTRPIGQ